MTTDKSITLNGDIPQVLKIVMVFIDRVGFPVLAFILMFYLSYSGLGKMTTAIESNTLALSKLDGVNANYQKIIIGNQEQIKSDIKEIQRYSYGYRDHLEGKN
jgi:hypothetical protein